ncbi:MAG: hypothetical protein ACI35J_05690, partial [Peribacillus sp.]
DWLKHSHSEAMLGTILYHLLSDPLRATALLASLNSNGINEDVYVKEEEELVERSLEEEPKELPEMDLDDFDWSFDETSEQSEQPEPEEENLDDLLGDFLDQMNQ